MIVKAIKTAKVAAGNSIFKVLDQYLPRVSEGTIIAVASKVIALSENRVIKANYNQKTKLIAQEAEKVIFDDNPQSKSPAFRLTLKNHRLLPNAGIDSSNSKKGHFILLPTDPQNSAVNLWLYLKKKHNLKKLGVIITDSNLTPMRVGVIGVALGWAGFKPVYSYVGKKDLFSRKLKVSRINLLDNLASAAILVMGEGSEQTPLAVVTDLPKTITFITAKPGLKDLKSTQISAAEDIFNCYDHLKTSI